MEEPEVPLPPPVPISPPPPSPAIVQAPPNVARFSLTDRPVPQTPQMDGPTFVLDAGTPSTTDGAFPAGSQDIGESQDRGMSPAPTEAENAETLDHLRGPAVESSLAALKKSDALERRASKRFSTYTFSKMTGTREKGNLSALDKLMGGSDARRNRRSAVFGGNLTPNELASLTEEPEGPSTTGPDVSRERASPSKRQNRVDPDAPPLPPLPESITPSRTPEPHSDKEKQPAPSSVPNDSNVSTAEKDPPTPSTPGSMTVFLRLGLQVKKVTLDRDSLSIPSLRLQFTEKFSYNPGMENFPAIYINDTDSHIQYELEDLDEIKERSLLSLNIERKFKIYDSVLFLTTLL